MDQALQRQLIVLGLAAAVAAEAARTGQVAASGEWLTCDGLGALILLLVAFVGFTAALFSWGYIAESVKHGHHKSIRLYYGLYNLFVLSMLAVPLGRDRQCRCPRRCALR
ncbi:MAG: hypothetical protein WAN27_20010, partial [Xanthobacteraceae bacterium]